MSKCAIFRPFKCGILTAVTASSRALLAPPPSDMETMDGRPVFGAVART